MNFKKIYKLSNQYFENLSIGSIFISKMRGFRPAKDYWIGICQIEDIYEIDENGEKNYAIIDFIFCKRSEKTLTELINLKQKVHDHKLKLIFKGLTSKGFPVFYHQFI